MWVAVVEGAGGCYQCDEWWQYDCDRIELVGGERDYKDGDFEMN